MAFGVVTLAKPKLTFGVCLSNSASVQTAGAGASVAIAMAFGVVTLANSALGFR